MKTFLTFLFGCLGLLDGDSQVMVNVGVTANDGTGDTVRDAFIKVNTNFTAVWKETWTNGVGIIKGTNSIRGVSYIWPADNGSASQRLTTDGNGVLTWETVSGGGGGIYPLDKLSDLLAYSSTETNIWLKGYSAVGDGGGGLVYKAASIPSPYLLTNFGTVFPASGGGYWIRPWTGKLVAPEWGVIPTTGLTSTNYTYWMAAFPT